MGWTRFLRRQHWDEERRREICSYIEIETDDNIARGMAPGDARRMAFRKLGNPTLLREEIYRMNTLGWLESLVQDLKYGARLLWRNPAFAVVAILSLSLGVGANTAIFQLIDAVRLRRLPVVEPDRLVEVRTTDRRGSSGAFRGRRPMLTNALWERIRDTQQSFDGMFAWGNLTLDLAAGGESRLADGLLVTGGYFGTLGVKPAAGRLIGASDDTAGCGAPVAVISYRFWQREYGGDRRVVGRPIRLDGRTYEIAGVTEAGFFGVDVGRSFDVALPVCAEPLINGSSSLLKMPNGWFLGAIGRLKPGVSSSQATAQLQAASPNIFQETLPPTYNAEEKKTYLAFRLAAYDASSGVSSIRRTYDAPLWILLATTGLVLLIACANLANLMLARATTREREIAVRLAIGASRPRIIRQLMSESLLLAAIGAAVGALLSQWMSGFLVSFLSTSRNLIFVALEPNWRVFGFAAALALTTCVLFGLAPAIRATHAAPASAMKAGTRSVTDSRERFGLRRALVVVQVALSLVLMAGAFLFVRSLSNLRGSELGFDASGILIASVDLRTVEVPEDRRGDFFRDMRERLARTPGVAGAAQADIVPISGSGWNQSILVDGTLQESYPNFNRVSPGFFELLGTPLVAGREFTDGDTNGTPLVAIVNESMAREYFKGASPLGRTFQIEEPPGAPRPHYQIVGVVRDTKYRDLRQPAGPIAYLASGQGGPPPTYMQYILRTQGPVGTAWSGVTKTLAQINPAIGVQIQTMEVQIRNTLTPERLMATLSGFFGGLAALIATIGLYGVMSYMVTRRKTEIGIRMALGARGSTVIRMVMGESAVLVGLGLVAGTVLAIYGARQVSTLLVGLEPGDPATLGMSVAALASVAIMASYVPAYRASRVDPTVALREE